MQQQTSEEEDLFHWLKLQATQGVYSAQVLFVLCTLLIFSTLLLSWSFLLCRHLTQFENNSIVYPSL